MPAQIGTVVSGITEGTDTLDLTNVQISGSNRAIVVFVLFNNNDYEEVSSVTIDPGGGDETALEWLDEVHGTVQDDGRAEIWGMKSPPTGTFTIRIILTGSMRRTEQLIGAAFPMTNVDQTTWRGTVVGDYATNGAPTVTVGSAEGEESGQYIEIEIYFDDIALLHPASMSDVLNGNFGDSGTGWTYDYNLQGFLAVCYYTPEEDRWTAMITQQYNTDAALYSYGAISQDIDISGQ